jgi:hypothetical protein
MRIGFGGIGKAMLLKWQKAASEKRYNPEL